MSKFFDDRKRACIGFWRPTDKFGWLGQWHMSDFECNSDSLPEDLVNLPLYQERKDVIDRLAEVDTPYSCAEMFMMAGKAALFQDDEVFADILKASKDPKRQKALGRLVSNFDGDTWDKYCCDIVKFGNYFKFTQSDELKTLLLDTNNKVLVEASPLDKIWGVGLKWDDPKIQIVKNWKGKNYLGECIMFVRTVLQGGSGGVSSSKQKAIVFDIDGVLVRGKQVVAGATDALERVIDAGMPFVFATNSGGIPEQVKADRMEAALGMEFSGEQVILSHTPVKGLVGELGDAHVLVVGDDGTSDAIKGYGFKKITTIHDLFNAQPLLNPVHDHPHAPAPLKYTTPIEAVMIMHEPADWGETLQLVSDVLGCDGVPPDCGIAARETPVEGQIPLYVANPDFIYQAQYPIPRYTQGAFIDCLRVLYEKFTGRKLEVTFYGKPTRASYKYIEHALATASKTSCDNLCVYAIGDNPKSDIRGANMMGDNWTSILVQTGCFKGDEAANAAEADDSLRADVVCRDVYDAIDFVLSQ